MYNYYNTRNIITIQPPPTTSPFGRRHHQQQPPSSQYNSRSLRSHHSPNTTHNLLGVHKPSNCQFNHKIISIKMLQQTRPMPNSSSHSPWRPKTATSSSTSTSTSNFALINRSLRPKLPQILPQQTRNNPPMLLHHQTQSMNPDTSIAVDI